MMLLNYFKIALRNLRKNPGYSFINISGLSVGIASSILIMLWVADEYSYDKFHPNYDRIYQVYQSQTWAQGTSANTSQAYALKDAIKIESSQIKRSVMTNWGEGNMLQVGDKRLNKFGISASEDFFQIFGFEMIKGNAELALADPNSIVITESTAQTFFEDKDPIGQFIRVDNGQDLKVTGVVKDVPNQSHFRFDYVLPFSYYEATQSWVRDSKSSWNNNSFKVYVELQKGAEMANVNSSIEDIVKKNNPKASTAKLFLHPMSKWRLHSNFENGVNKGGLIDYVRLFTAIAIFILVIACINFMNLATARSESRAREVGIRKSIGSSRSQLIYQFLGESIIVVFISSLVAIVLVELALPYYNTLVNKRIVIDYANPILWAIAIAWILVIGFFAGSYPAFYLSKFQPVKVLKGKLNIGKGASIPRQVLVTLQFGFSIFLIIGTIVIYQQIMHMKKRDIGYDKENLMMIWTNGELENNFQAIRTELENTGLVNSICKSNSPITAVFSSNEVEWDGKLTEDRVAFTTIATEYDYTKTMGIKLIEGRDFSKEYNDSLSVVINQAAVKMMGMESPVGKKIKFNKEYLTIIGVMPDIIMDSPDRPVEPLTLIFAPDWSSTITLRLSKTDNMGKSIDAVEDVFKKTNPSYPFEFRFADTDYNAKFSSINLISTLVSIFATLAILISCLGLLGLAAFTAEQRSKEVSIRKVMGATVSSIVILITKDFSKLVILGFVISAPLAWWALNNFLERYPYRISISWWMLPAAGIIALVMALIIVSSQALKAATSNPVKALKGE